MFDPFTGNALEKLPLPEHVEEAAQVPEASLVSEAPTSKHRASALMRNLIHAKLDRDLCEPLLGAQRVQSILSNFTSCKRSDFTDRGPFLNSHGPRKSLS